MAANPVTYPALQLYINGDWIAADGRETFPVLNPASGQVIACLPRATPADLDAALEAAERAFTRWRRTPAAERADTLHRAASVMRERLDTIARILTLEQGKPLAEARGEVAATADVFDWAAGEGRRAYGRIIPTRAGGVLQMVTKEPIGPVAGFSPWNGPALLFGRKVAEALAAGCSCIMKPAEETPATALEIARTLADAKLPAGVLNVVFGVPSEVSRHLITSPVIRKVSFTGSVEVGRTLAKMSGEKLKRITLELGGHAPVLIFDDADIDRVADMAVAAKYRNAGQTCASPTRFLVHEAVHERFVAEFSRRAAGLSLGDGLLPTTQMGPLANGRRLTAMERTVADACARGSKLHTGGRRRGTDGFFFEPTVLSGVPCDSELMTHEPFGPVVAINSFATLAQALAEANRLPYGLAAYAFTRNARTIQELSDTLESGVMGFNTFAINYPETPFGGIKDSGYGTEGGVEGVSGYLVSKYVAQAP